MEEPETNTGALRLLISGGNLFIWLGFHDLTHRAPSPQEHQQPCAEVNGKTWVAAQQESKISGSAQDRVRNVVNGNIKHGAEKGQRQNERAKKGSESGPPPAPSRTSRTLRARILSGNTAIKAANLSW